MINTNVLYKLKRNNDISLAIKARIAPQGNKDKDKDNLTTYCETCLLARIKIVLSVTALNRCKAKRADAKGALLKLEELSEQFMLYLLHK